MSWIGRRVTPEEAVTLMHPAGEAREYSLCLGGRRIAYLQERPVHCDRGRYHANIDIHVWRSAADPWPRYYFNPEHGMEEVEDYLAAKGIDLRGCCWTLVTSDALTGDEKKTEVFPLRKKPLGERDVNLP
jgi:hypothetical protein